MIFLVHVWALKHIKTDGMWVPMYRKISFTTHSWFMKDIQMSLCRQMNALSWFAEVVACEGLSPYLQINHKLVERISQPTTNQTQRCSLCMWQVFYILNRPDLGEIELWWLPVTVLCITSCWLYILWWWYLWPQHGVHCVLNRSMKIHFTAIRLRKYSYSLYKKLENILTNEQRLSTQWNKHPFQL